MGNLCGVALSIATGTGAYVPTRSPDPATHLDAAAVCDALRGVLEDEAIAIVGHDVKRAMIALRRHGVIDIRRLTWDDAAAKCNRVYGEVVAAMGTPVQAR